ncbi:MAG: chemotaxis protein CheW [Thermoanaerobaculia bacterium]
MSTKTRGRDTLPPHGLAEDVLPQSVARNVDLAAPDRLYQFADAVVAEQPKETTVAQKLETWVTFLLEGEIFALPVTHVIEILRVSGITRVPHAPLTVRGVTNMRGRVLPVIDLRVRLGLAAAGVSAESRILVVSSRGRLLGLLVDGVHQVMRLDRLAVEAPPTDVMTAQSDYIVGVYHLEQELAILLDVDRVLLVPTSIQQNVVASPTSVKETLS